MFDSVTRGFYEKRSGSSIMLILRLLIWSEKNSSRPKKDLKIRNFINYCLELMYIFLRILQLVFIRFLTDFNTGLASTVQHGKILYYCLLKIVYYH